MSAVALGRADLARIGDEVARRLGSCELFQERAYIRTPILLASGSTIVVTIDDDGRGGFSVSDLGQAADEADIHAVNVSFRNHAQELARLAGIEFRDGVLAVTGVRRDQLVGAVIAVADCAARSVERATALADERRTTLAVDRLVQRLNRVFRPERVHRAAEIAGASTHSWQVDALVDTDGRRAAFEIVRPHVNSVAAAATKFHDVARLQDAPARVAVVRSKAAMGDLLAVVSQAAQVIEEGAGDRTYERAALAA
jgi:hypothetical protein